MAFKTNECVKVVSRGGFNDLIGAVYRKINQEGGPTVYTVYCGRVVGTVDCLESDLQLLTDELKEESK